MRDQGYFFDRTRQNAILEALSQKDTSRTGVLEPFFPGVVITRLGVSCYPTTLLSNQLAQHKLKFRRVTVVVKSSFLCMHINFGINNFHLQ
jgi:hypothetical protein